MAQEKPLREFQDRYSENIGFYEPSNTEFTYYLFTPDNYDPQKQYPLVLLLHGASRHMKSTGVLTDPEIQEFEPSFVLVPIAPNGYDWGNFNTQRFSALPLAMSALEEIRAAFSIDPHRIYVSGYSMGGYGTYNAVLQYPDVFAAALPLCAGWPGKDAAKIGRIPVWIFHGDKDNIIPPRQTRQFVEAAKKKNVSTIQYTEVEGYGHNVWDYAYNIPEVWVWLLTKKKGE